MGNQDRLEDLQTCRSVASIPMEVNTKISLKPLVRQLPITATISGHTVLEKTPCGSFILIQELCVKVPIEIIVESEIGDKFPGFGSPPIDDYPTKSKYENRVNVVIDNKCNRKNKSHNSTKVILPVKI